MQVCLREHEVELCFSERELNYVDFTGVFLEEVEGKMHREWLEGAINGNTGSCKPDRWVYFNK